MPTISLFATQTFTEVKMQTKMFKYLQSRLSVIPCQEIITGDCIGTEIVLNYGNRTRINLILTDINRAVSSGHFPALEQEKESLLTLISSMRNKQYRHVRLEGETSALLTPQSRK